MHTLLLEVQQLLLWSAVSAGLDQEAQAGAGTSNFLFSLCQMVASVGFPSSDVQLAGLRPLVLEHMATCRCKACAPVLVHAAMFVCLGEARAGVGGHALAKVPPSQLSDGYLPVQAA